MYNLLKYSSSYKDKTTNSPASIVSNNSFKYFNYRVRLCKDKVAQSILNQANGIL